MSLLDKAKAAPTKRPYSGVTRTAAYYRERAELAIAFARSEITGAQAAAALGLNPKTNMSNLLGSTLIAAIRAGVVRAEVVE